MESKSYKQPPVFKKKRRYIVTYEDDEGGRTYTYQVYATEASIATALTISYINKHDHHPHTDYGYVLIPRIANTWTGIDYIIPEDFKS